MERVGRQRATAGGLSFEEYMQDVKDELPTGELVLPSAVAEMAYFLTLDACQSLNGASIVIDGGMIV